MGTYLLFKYPVHLLGILIFGYELITEVNSYDHNLGFILSDNPPTDNNHVCPATEKRGPKGIDPFDMSRPNSNKPSHRWADNLHETIQSENSRTKAPGLGWKYPQSEEGDSSQPLSSKQFKIYQKFVNVFLRATGLDLKDSLEPLLSRVVHLELTVTNQDLQLLQRFGRGDKAASVERVSTTLDNIFFQSQHKSSTSTDSLEKAFMWLSSIVVTLFSSSEFIVVTCVSFMFITVLWLVFITQSYRLAMYTALLMIFFGGFGFNWIRLYEEKEIEKYYDHINHGDVPYHCKGLELAWYQLVYYKWFGEDCLKFYKRRDVRAIVKVSPTEVLAVTISSMIVEPAKNIGNAYGCFIYGILGELPWYTKLCAVPLSFIIPPLITIIIVAVLCNYSLSLSLTGIRIFPNLTRVKAHRQEDKYIEDLPNKSSERCTKSGVFENILTGCKEPLFLWMNSSALKSLSPNVAHSVESINGSKSIVVSSTPEEKSEAIENKNSRDSAVSKEDVIVDSSESFKRRTNSICTCTETSSSVTSCGDVKDSSVPVLEELQSSGDCDFVPPSNGIKV